MKKLLLLTVAAAFGASTMSAAIATCTVTSGTVLTATTGGIAYSIANAIGTSTGGATGVITCPTISTAFGATGQIQNYQVLGTVDYQNGPFGTTSGTQVTQVLTLVGGNQGGATQTAVISGGNSSTGVDIGVPFQIGSTLTGATSYASFTVNVASSVTAGGPVGASGGQVVISYTDVDTATPEPSTYALLGLGFVGMGLLRRRIAR